MSLFHLLARRYSRLQVAAQGGAPLLPPTPTAAAGALPSPLTPWTPADTPQQPDAAQQAPQHPQPTAATTQQSAAAAPLPQLQMRVEAAAEAQPSAASAAAQQDAEQQELELQLYADFLRIVLEVGRWVLAWRWGWRLARCGHQGGPDGQPRPQTGLPPAPPTPRQIINSILTSALPQNPELVYTLLHRQVGGAGPQGAAARGARRSHSAAALAAGPPPPPHSPPMPPSPSLLSWSCAAHRRYLRRLRSTHGMLS